MDNNALIISAAETFSVRGIEMKLKSIGVKSEFSSSKVDVLRSKLGPEVLYILYTDEEMAGNTGLLEIIKDHLVKIKGKAMVIGSKSEYDDVTKVIPGDCIAGFFDRPLAMEGFLDAVEDFFSDTQERRKSILIVDDNVNYMSMIMDWLKDSYRVYMANSGVQAITWLATNHADLILLDYEMPVTSGPQVLEMIRSQDTLADIPVIFLTAVGDKESIMKVLALKPADYLLKTIDRKGLHDKIDNFFQSGK